MKQPTTVMGVPYPNFIDPDLQSVDREYAELSVRAAAAAAEGHGPLRDYIDEQIRQAMPFGWYH